MISCYYNLNHYINQNYPEVCNIIDNNEFKDEDSYDATIDMIVELDFEVNCLDRDGYAPIHIAIDSLSTDHIQFFSQFLNCYHVDVNNKALDGLTPLIQSINRGELLFFDRLLTHSDLNINDVDDSGNSALHYAVIRCIEEQSPTQKTIYRVMAEKLINHGIDTSLENNDDFTAYDYVLKHSPPPLPELILCFNPGLFEE